MGSLCVKKEKSETVLYSSQQSSQNTKVERNYSMQKVENEKVLVKTKQMQNQQKQIIQFNITTNDMVKDKSGIKITEIYTFLSPAIGKGTFGEVRKAIHKQTGHLRAIKIINKNQSSVYDEETLLNEVDMIKRLDHPNILKIYEYFQDEKRFYIVTELLTGGELFEKLMEQQYFSEEQAASIMQQMISAVAHCHKNQIVHRDIKPENLLLESKKPNANIKIIDFGTSKEFNPEIKIKAKAGTLFYMCPEILKGNYDEKCDI